jgi:hypothetical protein
VAGKELAGPLEEACELGRGHLTGGHCELTVMDLAETADMTLDRHVVGWISDRQRGFAAVHEPAIALLLEGAAAEDAVLAQEPEIAGTNACPTFIRTVPKASVNPETRDASDRLWYLNYALELFSGTASADIESKRSGRTSWNTASLWLHTRKAGST